MSSFHRRLIFYRRWKDHTDVTKTFPYLWSPAVPSHQLILTVSACFHVDVFERLPNGSKVHLNIGSCRLGSACFSVTANIPAFSSAWLDVIVVGLGTEGCVTHCAGHAAHNLSWEHLFNLVRRFQEKIHHLNLFLYNQHVLITPILFNDHKCRFAPN